MALFGLSACVSLRSAGALNVPEVVANFAAYDGRTVRVRGWLDTCQMLSCGLFATKEEALNRGYGEHMLSVGSTPDFDDQAVGRGPAEVIIVARVNSDCRSKFICMDRANELEPLAIKFLGKN